MWKSTRRGCF